MTTFTKKPSVNDNVRKLSELFLQLSKECNERFENIDKFIGTANDVLNALISIVGQDVVAEEIVSLRKQRQEEIDKKMAEAITGLKEKGVLVPQEVSTLESFLVGTDTLESGETKRVQFDLEGLDPEFVNLYVGKKVGDAIEGNGAKFVITEIYRIDKSKNLAKPEEKPAV